MKEQIDSSGQAKEQDEGEYMMENNLIFAQSDSLRIFTYVGAPGKEQLLLRSEFALNDQVLDIIRIPTTQFGGPVIPMPLDEAPSKGGRNQRRQKQSANDPAVGASATVSPDSVPYPHYLNSDLLFVLTKGLHCLLLGFNKEAQRAELISKGYLRD